MLFLLFLILGGCISHGQETIMGPSNPNVWQSWMDGITEQRTKALKSIKYNGSIFSTSPLQWTQSSFIQPQMHGYDQYFYNINNHSYTYNKFLNDLQDRYGGIDSMLFWTTYSNLGIDDRNQFDLQAAIPGGIDAITNIVNYMHNLNPPVKVLLPYTPWDTGTNYSGNPDYITLATFLETTGADGFNGDTMQDISEDFYTYSVNTFNHPIAMCPEWGGNLQEMNWGTISWGYWPNTNWKPNLGIWKWYDARHMTYITEKWIQNHTNDIQNAYFNAAGFNPFENVFGTWNGITPRDGEAIRRTATILRYFGNRNNNALAQNFTESIDWLPFIPIIENNKYWNDLFASSFVVNKGNNKQQILFLIINRNINDINNVEITFNNSFTVNINQLNIYDCYHGSDLKVTKSSNNKISVNIDIEGIGYGAILVTTDTRTSNKDLNEFLTTMSLMTAQPLNSFSSEWKYLLQTMTPIKPTKFYSSPPDVNMVTIPYGIFYFNDIGHDIAGGNNSLGQDVQYIFDFTPRFDHRQYMTMSKFYIDKYPVTCSKYKQYLTESKYKPRDEYNYLRNWKYTNGEYVYPTGYDNKPVTYLSLNEARLYCEYYGKRLPHSYEMAYSGQGNTSYNYPWGNKQEMGKNFPQTEHGRNIQGPADVDAFVPQGNSIFGVSDMIGNVWQYTDEFSDIHTRSVVLRGGSNYQPTAPNGLNFYFYSAYQLNQHGKYFLFDDSYERAGTLGFRCAADSQQPISDNPMFWNGNGNYCFYNNSNSVLPNGLLCGRISTGLGVNNLSMDGSLDWVQFGINYNDKSQFKIIRKQTNEMYISNITSKSQVSSFGKTPTPRGFYWNDGQKDIPIVNQANASTSGVFIFNDEFKWNINNLKGGNMYKLKIFVGVWFERGTLDVSLNVDGKTQNIFQDSTIYEGNQQTTNVCFELIIDLSSISSNKVIEVLVNWIVNKGNGNITLQAIALGKLLHTT